MSCLKVICWALIFIVKLRFPPGVSIATVLIESRNRFCLTRGCVRMILPDCSYIPWEFVKGI
jgi:hypothetical protein